jgi:hypoxanthine phosphoribosyltransferase
LRVLLSAEEIAARVDALAENFAAQVDDGWTVVALLQGAIPFAADLMRAIEKRGRHPIYDSLWLPPTPSPPHCHQPAGDRYRYCPPWRM